MWQVPLLLQVQPPATFELIKGQFVIILLFTNYYYYAVIGTGPVHITGVMVTGMLNKFKISSILYYYFH